MIMQAREIPNGLPCYTFGGLEDAKRLIFVSPAKLQKRVIKLTGSCD